MIQALKKICLFIIKTGAYLALFAPVIVYRYSFFPFVTPKTIYFRILVEIMLAAYLILILLFPRYRPKPNIILTAILTFIFVLIVTSVLGINFERSFWSTYERMTGIFTFLHLLAFFVILTSTFKKREDWEKILAVSVLVGIILCIGVLTNSQLSSRGGGAIGNTSFLAAYLLFDIFFALVLFLTKKSSFLRIFSGISLLFLIPTLLISTARGAIISFWFGLFLILLGYLLFSKKKKLQKIGTGLILCLVILAIAALVIQPSFLKDRVGNVLKDMKPRFVVWEKGWKGFLEKPIFGWGPENFNVVFTKFFNPCVFLSECGGEIWFDRVHNIVLDTLVNSGVIGLLSHLLIFAVSIFALFKICLKKEENMMPCLIMAALLIIYFAQNLLVFDMISSYTVFFLSLGFVSFLINEEKYSFSDSAEEPSNFIKEGLGRNIVFGLIISLTTLLLYFGNIQPFSSAVSVVEIVIASDNPEEMTVAYKKSLNTLMEKYEIREQFALKIYQSTFNSQNDKEAVKLAFDIGEEQMEESIRKNSLDFRPYLFLGRLYFTDYRFSLDKEKLDSAERVFEKAIELSPTNQQGYWHLAEVKLAQGESQATFDLFKKAIELEPRMARSHWYLATVYYITGQYEQALEKVKDAEAAGYNWRNNAEDVKKVTEIYKALGIELD
ncbi:MAG: O-antigen ligase family protein [Patescibacteria group bacterium]|nr:O-antigen ligase family protein [Patescibacteria group bacterium]